MITTISIVGSGNVATRLSLAFFKKNIQIKQIISRNKKSGKLLAKQTNSSFEHDIHNMNKTDLIILCVNDDNIENVANQLPDIPIIHTSGSKSIDVFQKKHACGVLYPIQTLNKEIETDFHKIPICIEGNNPNFEKRIFNLSQKISEKTFCLNSKQRKNLHLSAVIASNFSNFCYLIAKQNLDQNNLNFSLLIPLIIETAKNIRNQNPLLNQTGPAKRGDQQIMSEHLKMLKNKNHKIIYKLLSQNIAKEYEK